MKKTDVAQPVAMSSAFAEGVYSTTSTNDFEIPAATSTTADDSCVLDNGFLPITSTALDNGGKAPERKNFNGMFYLSTDQRFYLQNGGIITYNPDVATAIGGYPQGAILDYLDGTNYRKVISLIDDNQNNFVSDPTLIDNVNWSYLNIGNYVSKSGDTMTGALTITTNDNRQLNLMNSNIAQGSLPESGTSQYEYLTFVDNNSSQLGAVYYRLTSDGDVSVRLGCSNLDKSDTGYVGLGYNNAGVNYFTFPKCSEIPTTTSTALSGRISAVIRNYRNGTSGYVQFSDGLIIQWGQSTTAAQEAQISLLRNFTTTQYFVALQLVNQRNGSQQNISPYNKSTSSFYRTCNGGSEYNNPIAWIAIGY